MIRLLTIISCQALGLFVLFAVAGCGMGAGDETEVRAPLAAVVTESPDHVGSAVCADCHVTEYQSWQGSHHQLAMQTASTDTVLGNFDGASVSYNTSTSRFLEDGDGFVVSTDGPDGQLQDYRVRYAFGVAPLQQYLLDTGGGRYQALSIAWDSRAREAGGQRWFHLYPDEQVDHADVLHWTQPSATWNYMCADCHSTALKKNYDADSRSYATSYAEVSVGCEACHGAASLHVASARAGGPVQSLASLDEQSAQVNACAPCHSRRGQLAEGFQPSADMLDHYLPALLDEGLYHPDGQILDEVYVWGSFTQSKMYGQGVMCIHCHDPHNAGLKLSGNTVCTQCHNAAGRADFPSLPKANFDSPEHHFHAPDSAGGQCVACHMANKTYMVVDPRRDHSFRIPTSRYPWVYLTLAPSVISSKPRNGRRQHWCRGMANKMHHTSPLRLLQGVWPCPRRKRRSSGWQTTLRKLRSCGPRHWRF